MKLLNIGILALQGDVYEHFQAAKKALENLKLKANILEVRTKSDLHDLDALIIPGGESTTLYKLCQRENIFKDLRKIRNIFGTCAGAIMLSKNVSHKIKGQKTLKLMDIEIDRNAYGRQIESFEYDIDTIFGSLKAIFIRAPKIKRIGKNISIVAKNNQGILACEKKRGGNYYLAACFHPELTTTKFHEYFFQNCIFS